jgi:uncharacterized protein
MDLTQLKQDVLSSLKSRDICRTQTLRMLLSDVRYAAIAKYKAEWESKVSQSDVTDVIRKQIKTHKESIEMFSRGGRNDLVDKETAELKILEAFVPKQMSDTELKEIITGIVKNGEKNFGKLMGQVMAKVGKDVDGSRVSTMLKEMLH